MTVRAVFAFEGYADDLAVHLSIEDAAAYSEVYDLDVLTFFTDDGTVLSATGDDDRVLHLTPTMQRGPEELLDRLKTFLSKTVLSVSPEQADDPIAYAKVLSGSGWHRRPKGRRREATDRE